MRLMGLVFVLGLVLIGLLQLGIESKPTNDLQFREEFDTALYPTDYRVKTLLQSLVNTKLSQLVAEATRQQRLIQGLKREQQLILQKPQSDDNSIKLSLKELAVLDDRIKTAEGEYESLRARWKKRRAVAMSYGFSAGIADFRLAIESSPKD
jgi:hypothetical protein